MKKNFILSIIFIVFAYAASIAQEKTLTLDELFRNRSLYPRYYTNLQWIGTTHEYSYVDGNALMAGNTSKEDDRILVSLEKLNKSLQASRGTSLKRFPSVEWTDDSHFIFLSENELFIYSVIEGTATKHNNCGENAENIDVAPSTHNIAFTEENNLYVACNDKIIQATFDPDTGIVNGKTVHRNEWGIGKGIFWSPKGNLLAFYRMDESMVTQYPLIDIEPTPAKVKFVRYPMAGMNSHQVTIGVFDPAKNKTVFLQTGEPADQFLTNVTWTPDEKYILVAVLNRDQNHMWMKMYDAATGASISTLFEETDEQYVEPLNSPVFLNKTPTQFIWQSKRDGYNHLYLYDVNGTLISQLTSGKWSVNSLQTIGADDKLAWFTATKESPLNVDLYSVEIKTGKIIRCTEESGTHEPVLSKDQSLFIDDFSSTKMAALVGIYNAGGKLVKELLKDENPLENYKTGKTEIFTLKSDLGDDLYCRMIKPVDFDSTRKYPVVIYVYGGPHSQLINNSWLAGAGMFLNYLASCGYVVFSLDNHGTANRGQDFEQVIHRQLGVQEVSDQMVGVDFLKGLPYVDRNRIAVHGWSYGGFLTISMLVQHPTDFKVGIAGGPVIDWKYYEVMYGERYMDTPQENADGYEKSSLLSRADQLKADLLIINGTLDETVVPQNSLEFIQKCIESGILLDYFVYPGHEHNISGIDRLHLYRKIEEYLSEHL